MQLDDLSGAILKVTPSASPELLPLGGSQGADSLRKWWLRRAVPISQGNIAALLQQEGIPSTQSLLVRNLGLSLSDHYWIKPNGSELTWKNVSPFSNAFSDLSETASAQFYSPDVYKRQLRRLRTEIHQIGNNINQLARKANAGFASRDEVTRALRMLDRVYELMYEFSK